MITGRGKHNDNVTSFPTRSQQDLGGLSQYLKGKGRQPRCDRAESVSKRSGHICITWWPPNIRFIAFRLLPFWYFLCLISTKGGYVFGLVGCIVCFFVCMSVCYQVYLKSNKRFAWSLYQWCVSGQGISHSIFGNDPDHDSYLEFQKKICASGQGTTY